MKFTKLTIFTLLLLSYDAAFASADTAKMPVGSLVERDSTNPFEPGLNGDELFNKLIHQESRGNQFRLNGEPLTSPKGAVGVAQVMPETGPEAARLAGLEWNVWRYRNDATYNKALGRAYLVSQLDKYDGNHVLALAAYNAGPGRVDKWLKRFGDPRTGEVTNQRFIQLIPFLETQSYVATILNNAQGKFSYSASRRNNVVSKGYKVEFRDTHPGFTFNLAVNQTFSTASGKLVGGL